MDAIERTEIAFRKLKAHVYFDKTALTLRDKVVEFESENDFRDKIKEIAIAYENDSFEDDNVLIKEILDSISVLHFPKSMQNNEIDDQAVIENVISIGNPQEIPVVSTEQHFIDMDVRGHILGALWIMEFGKKLDEDCFENARGNRLRNNLIWGENGNLKKSPALFEPYFSQYSLWRDDALSCAEEMLSEGHDALILTLDLKSFYYRVGITEEEFYEIHQNENLKKKQLKNKNLNKAVFAIIRKYTQELCKVSNFEDNESSMLPIGFLPSAILSNWCLSKFDKGVLDFWNPSYYGRYVDDLIIIEKIEKGSEIYSKAREGKLKKEFVIDYYLGHRRSKDGDSFVCKTLEVISKNDMNEEDRNNYKEGFRDYEDTIYRVNKDFCLSEKSNFEFQMKKTRIIALFEDNNSNAIIEKFKQEIYNNVSEFRLMPEMDDAFTKDDFSSFYSLENDATINKLRGVKSIALSKYELSKFLGKYRVVSSLIDDGKFKKFTYKIRSMFNDSELIANYIHWERLFEIFITDKDYDGLIDFVQQIDNAIKSLTFEREKNKKDVPKIDINCIRKSLNKHLSSSLNRSLTLLWGKEAKRIFMMTSLTMGGYLDCSMRAKYIKSRMSNKYAFSIPLDSIEYINDDDKFFERRAVNLTDFNETFLFLKNRNKPNKQIISDNNYDLLPYYPRAQDIGIEMFIKDIYEDRSKQHDDYWKAMNFSKDNENFSEDNNSNEASFQDNDFQLPLIGDQKMSKMKIAIANVSVNAEKNLEDVLTPGRKSERSIKRYKTLSKTLNEAIIEKADMLVFPESYLPFEWLSALANKAAQEGIAVITGIEHIVIDKKVYNYTAVILPFKQFDVIPTAAVFLQLKKHYAPEEKRVIHGYGFKAVEEKNDYFNPLYNWRDCRFPVYCCYELTDIKYRSKFMSWADMIVAVVWNKDTNYFGNIVESLARDLHCYCVQVNTSEYGDSRIVQPKKTEAQDLIKVKGGKNPTVLIDEIDIKALREFQIMNYELQKEEQKKGSFKPTPNGIERKVIIKKLS